MKVINIYGGPGCGKSVVASELFSKMKKRNYKVELVTEFAKELVYQHRINYDQLIILGEQYRRIQDLAKTVDYIITDSPVLLSAVYCAYNNNFNTPEFKQVCYQAYSNFDSIDILLEKDFEYFEESGRIHNEAESVFLQQSIKDVLEHFDIKYHIIQSSKACDEIFNMIKKK